METPKKSKIIDRVKWREADPPNGAVCDPPNGAS